MTPFFTATVPPNVELPPAGSVALTVHVPSVNTSEIDVVGTSPSAYPPVTEIDAAVMSPTLFIVSDASTEPDPLTGWPALPPPVQFVDASKFIVSPSTAMTSLKSLRGGKLTVACCNAGLAPVV